MFKHNFILQADAYKNEHGKMLKAGVTHFESILSARKKTSFSDHVMLFGLQYFIETMLSTPITLDDIDVAEQEIIEQLGSFDRQRWEIIVNEYGGYLPLEIRAVPEGRNVTIGCPLVKVVNTDERFGWLTSYIETALLRNVWYMSTVATLAFRIKTLLQQTMRRHEGHDHVDYMLHDFGSRSNTSCESVIEAGMAHALSFAGSDTLETNRAIKYYYHTHAARNSSIIASEHSVSCSMADAGKRDDSPIIGRMLALLDAELSKIAAGQRGCNKVSIVADTYDVFHFVNHFIGEKYKEEIIALGQRGGVVVVRPDSGNPITMPIEIVERLMSLFGYSTNEQGYKVLPDYLRVIQGDGINQETIKQIIEELEAKKLSVANLCFGMGGQLVNPAKGRDMFSFAMKATAQCVDGQWQELYKDPITDSGKRSLKGRVTTYLSTSTHRTFADRIGLAEDDPQLIDMMQVVWRNGCHLKSFTFEEVMQNTTSQ